MNTQEQLNQEIDIFKQRLEDFENILQSLPLYIFRCTIDEDGDYIITFIQGKLAEDLGIKEEKVKGKKLKDIAGEELFNKLKPYYNRAFNNEIVKYVEYQYNAYSLTILAPLERADKKVIEIVGISQDVTEIRKLDEELKRDKKVIDDIIESNPYSVQICDAEGHHIRANKAFEKLFGPPPPPEWSLFNDPLLKKAGDSELLAKLKKGETIKIPAIWYNAHDVNPKAPDSPICLGAAHFPVLDNKGNLEFIVNMHEDITERKRAEEERENYKKKLEEKVDELEEFHDLAVGRELKMVELKKEIEELKKKV